MGYYSDFNMNITYPPEYDDMAKGVNTTFLDFLIKKMSSVMEHNIRDIFDIIVPTNQEMHIKNNDSIKWYGYMEDLIKISNMFPGILIHVYVNGEESGHFEEHYFKNGKVASSDGQIVFWKNKKDVARKQKLLSSISEPSVKPFLID